MPKVIRHFFQKNKNKNSNSSLGPCFKPKLELGFFKFNGTILNTCTFNADNNLGVLAGKKRKKTRAQAQVRTKDSSLNLGFSSLIKLLSTLRVVQRFLQKTKKEHELKLKFEIRTRA
jgi:hypothetical protein